MRTINNNHARTPKQFENRSRSTMYSIWPSSCAMILHNLKANIICLYKQRERKKESSIFCRKHLTFKKKDMKTLVAILVGLIAFLNCCNCCIRTQYNTVLVQFSRLYLTSYGTIQLKNIYLFCTIDNTIVSSQSDSRCQRNHGEQCRWFEHKPNPWHNTILADCLLNYSLLFSSNLFFAVLICQKKPKKTCKWKFQSSNSPVTVEVALAGLPESNTEQKHGLHIHTNGITIALDNNTAGSLERRFFLFLVEMKLFVVVNLFL